MQIIKLPPVLPGDLDLAAVNQQLRQGAAQLNWSAVVSCLRTTSGSAVGRT